MSEQQIQGNLSDAGDKANLDAIQAARAGVAYKLKLFQSTFHPTNVSAKADFAAHEATYAGYAAQALAWSADGFGVDGNWLQVSTRMFFQSTDAVTPNEIGGGWLEDNAGNLTEYFTLTTPVELDAAGKFMAVTLTLSGRAGLAADVEY